jgi:hypothetical protein
LSADKQVAFELKKSKVDGKAQIGILTKEVAKWKKLHEIEMKKGTIFNLVFFLINDFVQ